MNASVLDRFIFRTATAIRVTPAIPDPVSEGQSSKVARIAGIALANANAGEFFDSSADASNEPTETPSDWWAMLRARIDECDRLIHELCDLRCDGDARRADLLAVRRRMAPQMLDSDIVYLKSEIAGLTPSLPRQSGRRCIECEFFARVGIGERCSHPDRSLAGEPPRADCLPANECDRFIYWRATHARNSNQ